MDFSELLREKKRMSKWAYDEIISSFNAGAGLLFYYKSELGNDRNLKGVINLRGCDGVAPLPADRAVGRLRYGFEIHVPAQRAYLIVAESEQVRQTHGPAPRACLRAPGALTRGQAHRRLERTAALGGRSQQMEAWIAAIDGVVSHMRQVLLLLSKHTSSSRDNLMWI